MHILDIAQNSTKALASVVTIEVFEDAVNNIFSFSISDNGTGMSRDRLEDVRARMLSRGKPQCGDGGGGHGLGLWMLRLYCEANGGRLEIHSEKGSGTRVTGKLRYDSPNRLPMGDIGATLRLLRLLHPYIEFEYLHN